MNLLQTIFDTLAGIIMSFLLFWGSFIPALQITAEPPVAPGPTEQALPVSTTSTATSTPAAASSQPGKAPAAATPVPTPAPTLPPAATPPPPAPTKTQAQINEETRAALVNILCIPQAGINGISGSGVLVDSRGVILTNAHIAQYFLLRDYLAPGNINCVVRAGSPAQARYTATLLYVPPAWVAANAAQLKAAQAVGTGEYDFAFLLINGRTDITATLPGSFPYLAMDRGYADVGDAMLLAAYPAGFLGTETVQKSLYISSAVAYVTQLFSFSQHTKVDLFSIGGTVVSQGGSSGGAAVRLRDGTLAGVIATATAAASTGERDLRAVSLSHIDDMLAQSGLGGIKGLLSGDLSAKAADFNTKTAPALTAQLEKVLSGN